LMYLCSLDMEQRSALAKLCRAQCYPPTRSRLGCMTKCVPEHILSDILPMCQTPLLAGLLLQCVLLAPLPTEYVVAEYEKSLMKEMTVMNSVRRVNNFNFDPLFGDIGQSIHPDIPPNECAARFIFNAISSWKNSLWNKILYPRVGSKTVSKWTARQVRLYLDDYVPNDPKGITPIDLERIYHQHGVKVGGPCELRQKWYYTNLTPRTYFAQGGDAYFSSTYLSKSFTDLCDKLPATNRRTRVCPGRITIRNPSDDVIYYDLTAFTSNLHIQVSFMARLSLFCRGTLVRVLDSFHGIVERDLGELIHEYVMTNLHEPSYTLQSRMGDNSMKHYHNVAGFLGVYGNIATATFIHGAIMTMLHDNDDECNVAGDDGLSVSANPNHTIHIVGEMGTVMDEKTFRESEGCCIHLKRPIQRIGNRLLHGQLITWPSLEVHQPQSEMDERYPYLRHISKRDRREAIISSITAFLRTLELQTLDEHDLNLIDTFLSSLYSAYDLPRGGCVPQTALVTSCFIPAYERRYIGLDPLHNTISRNYSGVTRLPIRGRMDFRSDMVDEGAFRCNSTPLLNHLVVLGYLEQKKEFHVVFGDEGYAELLKEYINPELPIYTYEVVTSLPTWLGSIN